jgi:hypothetical protein
MSLTPVECQGDAYPLLLRRYQLQAKVIVHRYRDLLIRPKVALCRLDGRVPQQEFDLLQIPAIFPAQLGTGAAQVVGAEVLDPDLLR